MTVNTNYKAIVKVNLGGGRDPHHTLSPYDVDTHALFMTARPDLMQTRAVLGNSILNPITALAGGKQYALHSNLAPLLPIWETGDMAVVLNMGPMYRPTSKADYNAGIDLPPKLFDHDGQTVEMHAAARTRADGPP